MITLRRAYLPFDAGVMGRLIIEGHEFATLELPWRQNRISDSCIPEGVYRLRKRRSAVIKRSTGGEFEEGWEVTGVSGRTFIMLHPGNFASDTEGCIMPGWSHFWNATEGFGVRDSRPAFRALMKALDSRDEWDIDIRCNCPEYP